MTCKRCGMETERLTVAQRYDPRCAAEVAAQDRADAARRSRRFPFAKDLSGASA